MENTGIQWATHTWNPWRGCERVSEGCDHCYAEAMSHRNPGVLGVWTTADEPGTRPLGNETYLRQPYAWDRKAAETKDRPRVFLGSLMDVWEDRTDLLGIRERVLMTAYECHHLNFLFLTKRPQNITRLLALARHRHHPHDDWLELQTRATRPNWWMGCTVENAARARERIPVLREVPAALRFLSVEPLLEPLDLSPFLAKGGIGWVIVGGESDQGGARARPFDLEWCEEVVNACRAFKVPVFVKQIGSRPVTAGLGYRIRERHGGDPDEWPEWMRVREVPTP